MTWLSDTTPLVADGWLSSAYAGHGIRGADVPSSGANGPAILYPGLVLPDEADDQFRALILTRPATLPGLVIFEDSSLDTGDAPPDGVHVGTWRGYKNGVVYGPDPSTYTITIGSTGGSLGGGAVLDGPSAAGGLNGGAPSTLSGGAVLDGPAAAGVMGAGGASQLGGGATLDGPVAAGGLDGGAPSQLSGGAVLDGPAASGGMAPGDVVLTAQPMYTLFAPRDQIENLGGFAPKDPDARVLLAFEFRRWLTGLSDADVGIIRWRGAADANPQAVLDGPRVLQGTRVFQWVHQGVLNCDYELRVVATGPDGSKAVLEGILPVRDA